MRLGTLLWLSVKGLPLHALTAANFDIIGSNFGIVVEVDDFTANRRQIHIGRVLVHSLKQNYINKVVNISFAEETFLVRVLEDFIEVVDSGPRYEAEETHSRSSLGSGIKNLELAQNDGSEDGSLIPDSSPEDNAAKLSKGRTAHTFGALDLVKSLNALHALSSILVVDQPPLIGPDSNEQHVGLQLEHPALVISSHSPTRPSGKYLSPTLPQVDTSLLKICHKSKRDLSQSSLPQTDLWKKNFDLPSRFALREAKRLAHLKSSKPISKGRIKSKKSASCSINAKALDEKTIQEKKDDTHCSKASSSSNSYRSENYQQIRALIGFNFPPVTAKTLHSSSLTAAMGSSQ